MQQTRKPGPQRALVLAGGGAKGSYQVGVWQALQELGTLVAQGKLKPRESIAQGIESAPEAFLGLLKGKNFGKQLVKLI